METAARLYLKRYRPRYRRSCLAYSHALVHHLRVAGCPWPPRCTTSPRQSLATPILCTTTIVRPWQNWRGDWPPCIAPGVIIVRSATSFCPRYVLDEQVVAAFVEAYSDEEPLSIEHPYLIWTLWFFGTVKWAVKMLALMTEGDLPRLLRSVELVAAELERARYRLAR